MHNIFFPTVSHRPVKLTHFYFFLKRCMFTYAIYICTIYICTVCVHMCVWPFYLNIHFKSCNCAESWKSPDILFLFLNAEISGHALFLKPIICLVIYAKEIKETMTGRPRWPFSNPSTKAADIFLINATGGRWRRIFSSPCYLCISSSGLYIIHISEICLPRHWRPAFHFLLASAFLFIILQNLPVMLKNSWVVQMHQLVMHS